MKTSSLLAATAASAALALAPATAFAYNVPDGTESIVVQDADTTDCVVPVAVDGGSATDITVTVTDSSGVIVSTVTKSNDADLVEFVVDLGENCSGNYSIVATDQNGNVLDTAVVSTSNGGTNAGGGDTDGDTTTGGSTTGGSTAGGATTDDNVGGLPATGSSNALLLSGVAGGALLAGGGLVMVRRRRVTA